MIKVGNDEQCTLTFTHWRTREPASYEIMRNPLTGNWLQTHRVGEEQTSYYSDKTQAVRLANQIIKKSAELKLPCTVDIRPRTVMPSR